MEHSQMRTHTKVISSEPQSNSFRSIETGTISSINSLLENSTDKIQEDIMGRNENHNRKLYENNMKTLGNNNEGNIKIVLNQIDTSFREFGVRLRKFVQDPFKYFAEQCGYKSSKQFYSIFEQRPGYDLKLKDAKKIYDETEDERILEAIVTYFKMKDN